MEGLQLRREDEEEKRATKMQELPLESSPHLKCTDLENYKIMIGYATATAAAQGQLCLDGGVVASATAADGTHVSPREVAAIERKLK